MKKEHRKTCSILIAIPALVLSSIVLACVGLAVAVNIVFALLWNAPDSLNTGAVFDPDGGRWIEMSTDDAPSGRYRPYAFWTGHEVLVWGGFIERADFPVNDTVAVGGGGLYNPLTNTWRRMPTEGDPGGRGDPAVVWTGNELIVWGGVSQGGRGTRSLGDGARYDPSTNSWTPMSKEGAPSPRFGSIAIWTGEEVIIWGGSTVPPLDSTCLDYSSKGARYDPATDTWKPMTMVNAPPGRREPAAVWTGSELIIWAGGGGRFGCQQFGGARYDPSSDTWHDMPKNGPSYKDVDVGVWTGNDLLLWGPTNFYYRSAVGAVGAFFDPGEDDWRLLPDPGLFDPTSRPDAHWAKDQLLVDGPARTGGPDTYVLAIFDSESRDWQTIPHAGLPAGDPWVAGWNGSTAIVLSVTRWDEPETDESATTRHRRYGGWRYDSRSNNWNELPEESAPSRRVGPAVIWTGKVFIVWGGLETD